MTSSTCPADRQRRPAAANQPANRTVRGRTCCAICHSRRIDPQIHGGPACSSPRRAGQHQILDPQRKPQAESSERRAHRSADPRLVSQAPVSHRTPAGQIGQPARPFSANRRPPLCGTVISARPPASAAPAPHPDPGSAAAGPAAWAGAVMEAGVVDDEVRGEPPPVRGTELACRSCTALNVRHERMWARTWARSTALWGWLQSARRRARAAASRCGAGSASDQQRGEPSPRGFQPVSANDRGGAQARRPEPRARRCGFQPRGPVWVAARVRDSSSIETDCRQPDDAEDQPSRRRPHRGQADQTA